jgi:lipopolysaccharide/colanic/teichoic acid biosynthesis glycosyltransferase
MKRLVDVLGSTIALISSSPVLFGLAVLIKLDSRGPVFYRGVRVGRHGRPFRIFKFRTMVVNAEQLGASSSADDDPRLTRVGRFLRRYKFDEVPQLLNVLLGHMSLVGPRPQVQWAVDLYSEQERQLLSVRPGITDYASIRFRNEGEILRGSADPDRDYLEKIAPEKMRLALEYVRNRSLWIDTKIVLATVWAVLGGNPERILGSSHRVCLCEEQFKLRRLVSREDL